ncbi:hypothetical protein CUR178_05784 [Leishmania enriettii]|uniref:Uncharacterized protein n=1 Tax=Leishmania enriettii TaxID=5663 RepID=A0A836KS26_LEIEN|nr:hypothetical protein CUR178_05784 [Leishmania enriettii]
MKCVLIVRSGDERTQRSCELPDGVSTRKQLRAFVQSQDLRLNSVDFTFAVSLVERATGVSEGKKGKVVLRGDADVLQLLQKAEKRRATHVLTFAVTISGSAASPQNLGSLLSAEYAVDDDLVTLHVFAPLTSPSRGTSVSYQEKTFIIPTRFVLESLTRAVEDTLSISPTKSGMRLALYTVPRQHKEDRVEITDDAAALRLLRQHASQRTPVRLTYATCARTPIASSRQASRRASQQQFAASHASPPPAPAPAPPDSTAVPRNPKPHLPPLSRVASQSSSEHSHLPLEREGVASPPLPYRKADAPPSPAPPPSSLPAAATAPSPTVSSGTPRRVFLREHTTPFTEYEARVQVLPAASEGRAGAAATVPVHELCFVFTKEEMQLWRRFAAECVAAAGAKAATHVPVLSSDASVRLDSDGTLREWLALARESKQPLRVRLSLYRPSPPPPAEAEMPAAHAPESVVPDRGAAPAESEGATAIAAVPTAKAVGDRKQGPSVAPRELNCSENPWPSIASPSASSSRPSYNDDRADGVGAAPRRMPSPQLHSLTSLEDVAASPATPSGSPLKVGSTASGTCHAPPLSKASFSSARAEGANGETITTCEDDIAVAGAPLLVMCTTAGPSDAAATAARVLCVCESDDGEPSSVRFQSSVRWGTEQRMVLCRLREGVALDDLRRAALDTFCSGAAGVDGAPSLAMEMRYRAKGQIFCVRLDAEARLLDLRDDLLVDSAEMHVTAPSTPPSPPRTQETNGNADDVAQITEGVLQLLADAVLHNFGSRPPATGTEISDVLRAKLGEQAATQPIRGFLDAAAATPCGAIMSQREDDVCSRAHLVLWLSSVLAGMQAPAPSVTEAAVEVASSFLCTRLCDVDFLLDQFAASVSVADSAEGRGDGATPSATVRPSLAALWTDAGLVPPQSSSAAAWNPFRAAHVGGTSGWKTAYATAPAAMLDLVAAGSMDGVWAFPYRRDAPTDVVWHRSLAKAHCNCCKAIDPADLERFFKAGDCSHATGALDHRRVILSCVGALLAPTSAAVSDYAEWLAQRFRGKVATVLYTNMIDYDGSSSLSAFAVTQLSWTLLHPQLRSGGEAGSLPTTLDRLHAWALLATQRVCQRRHVHFPPRPLFRFHTASPAPLVRPPAPTVVAADTAADDAQAYMRMPTAPLPPSCDAAAAGSVAAPFCPSPPAGAPHFPTCESAPRKLQYDYRYNFNVFRRPRSSKG